MKTNRFSPFVFFNSKLIPTISISMLLFLLGVVVFLFFFAKNLSTYVKESLSFDIILLDHTSKQQIDVLKKELYDMPFVKSVSFTPKKQALDQLSKEIGQNPLEFLGFNPLPDLIEVYLKHQYANCDSLVVIKNHLKNFSDSIKKMEFREKILKTVTEYITKASFVFFAIALIILIIPCSLVNNTIRIMVYSKRFLIRTMQLIGAKRWYVFRSFILPNVFIGIVASTVACSGLYCLVGYVKGFFLDTDIYKFFDFFLLKERICCGIFVLGILITFLTTYFAVKKYIDMDVNKLYKM